MRSHQVGAITTRPCCNPPIPKLSRCYYLSRLHDFCKCSHQTPSLQSSLPLGPHFRSRRTPAYGNIFKRTVRLASFHRFISFTQTALYNPSSVFLTCSQVSRIMTSSVARSSWVISPGTSSIWQGGRGFSEATLMLWLYKGLLKLSDSDTFTF